MGDIRVHVELINHQKRIQPLQSLLVTI